MTMKLKLSSQNSDKLASLSGKLDLRRNIVCRLAIGRSLSIAESVKDMTPVDSNGYEFNKYTLTGENDIIYKSLIIQHERKSMMDNEYFSIFLRNHLERGIEQLYHEFERVKSPVEFLVTLASRVK